jgi:nucleoside-diphosphate-sugar epimerase
MSVLITGATGFVGLNLAQALLEKGEDVVLFDLRLPPALCLERFALLPGRLRSMAGDVRRAEDIARVFEPGDITHVFHGAAVTAGPVREAAQPQHVIDVNLSGTVAVLRAAADAGVARFVYPSSLTVYGEHLFGSYPISEQGTPAAPDTLYGITKYAAERAALRLGALWNVPVLAGRIGAVFGPWEAESGARDLISPYAQVAAAAARGLAVRLPAAYPPREMIYSVDLAHGLCALLFAERPSHQVYNLSSNTDWSDALASWCGVLAERMPGFRWRYADGAAAFASDEIAIDFHDARPRASLSAARLRDDLGFTSHHDRDSALADYAGWLEKNRAYFA